MPCSSWSSTAHSDITRQPRASTEKLDSPRQQLDAPAHGVSLDRLDRNSTGSTRLDRQGLDNGLDNGSTEPRQLDSSTARAQFTLPVLHLYDAQWYTCRRPGAGRNSEPGPQSLQLASEAQLHVSARILAEEAGIAGRSRRSRCRRCSLRTRRRGRRRRRGSRRCREAPAGAPPEGNAK